VNARRADVARRGIVIGPAPVALLRSAYPSDGETVRTAVPVSPHSLKETAMNRNRIPALVAVAALSTAGVLGMAPSALAATPAAAQAASTCVQDLQAAQTSNNAAIAADTAADTVTARTDNLSTVTSLTSAAVDCLVGQPLNVVTNVVTATANNALATVFNTLGNSAAALDREQTTATAISEALAIAH
jgi:hypothetical protein